MEAWMPDTDGYGCDLWNRISNMYPYRWPRC
jgi:hypothetical protein